ncbi:hypothetical protein [Mycobacterium sp. MYCO198283]|uniref:hypothetical protein n=1 Tax=Mycobacterium sp. MYCO198283 TaxID=2883505 RepID=UPI0035ABD8CD
MPIGDDTPNPYVRYRLVVIAPTVAELVTATGGWVFDRVMGGWDVTAIVGELHDERPLRVLGAEPIDLASALALRTPGPRPQAIAVSAEFYERDDRVRRGVLDKLEMGITEVTMWGDHWPSELDEHVTPVEHRLSVAARAFKRQAMVAATGVGACADTERFRSGHVVPCYAGLPDLVPAG